MLFGIEIKITERPRGFRGARSGHHAMRTRELGHDEATAALAANQTAENRIRDPGHRREYRRRSDIDRTNLE